ncbi:MAG: single-stranded-DNA-specific exonuclease RecJ, partial [Chloroflexota bacterium]
LEDKAHEILEGMTLTPTISVDMELTMREATIALAKELNVLEPTGHANEQAVFMSRNLEVVEIKTVGANKDHLKLKLKGDGEPPIDAIGFRLGEWAYDLPSHIDVVYNLEINEWQGRRNLQLNLRDIRPAEESATV